MTGKKRFSAWISPATREKILALQERYGTQAEVLAVAIDRLYAREILGMKTDGAEILGLTLKLREEHTDPTKSIEPEDQE